MSKEKNNTKENTDNPFAGFGVINLNPTAPSIIQAPKVEEPVGKIETGDKVPNLTEDEHKEKAAEATKTIEEPIQEEEAPETKTSKKSKYKEEEVEEEQEEVAQETEDTEVSPYRAWAEDLANKGLLAYDPDNFEDSEEGLTKAFEDTVISQIEAYKESLPDVFNRMLEYYEAGGDLRQFSKIYFEGMDWSNYDLANENSQKTVIREALSMSGESKEDIDEMINEWSDLGTLEKHAKRNLTKLQRAQEEYKAEMVEYQKQQQAAQAEANRKHWESFRQDLFSKDNIKGFKLTPKQKEDMWRFITVPDKRTGLTGLQQHYQEDKDSQLLYTYLAMNKWNLDSLKREVKNEVTSKLSQSLKNIKNTDSRAKVSRGQSERFSDEGGKNFSGFKQAFLGQ